MPKIHNRDDPELYDARRILEVLKIIEITGYSIESILGLPYPQYKALALYCSIRVEEQRRMMAGEKANDLEDYVG